MSLVRGDTAVSAKTQYERFTPSSESFDKLPLELMEIIILLIDMSTLCALRTTCRFLARCTHYYFVDKYIHTASIDFSKAALDRVKRLARRPESASMLTTLVVKPADRKFDSSGFGAGIDWKSLKDGALDMSQSAVREWVDALRCLDYEALAIAMLVIKVTRIPAESLDLHTVDFWDLDSNYKTFPQRNRVDQVFPAPSRDRRPRSAPWAHLQSLTLTNILHVDHGDRFASLLASARALKSPKLAGIPDDFSFKVLSSLANPFRLERLEISGMHRTPIQMPAFLNALRKHRHTLKKLVVSDSTLHDDARWSHVFRTLRQGRFGRFAMRLPAHSSRGRCTITVGTALTATAAAARVRLTLSPTTECTTEQLGIRVRVCGGSSGDLRRGQSYGIPAIIPPLIRLVTSSSSLFVL
ncbi:hypothetical protein BJX62DRAFT_234122 [Aspergillus germanicus]